MNPLGNVKIAYEVLNEADLNHKQNMKSAIQYALSLLDNAIRESELLPTVSQEQVYDDEIPDSIRGTEDGI